MSKIHSFENIFLDNEISNVSPQFKIQMGSTQSDDDPLEGVAMESSVPNLYRLNQLVFAEPVHVPQSSKCNKDDLSNEEGVDDSFLPELLKDKPDSEPSIKRLKRGRKNKYLSAEEDIGPHKCPELSCIKEFPTKKRAAEHHHKIHMLERDRFPCDKCSQAFPERYLLVRHSAVHERARRQCLLCLKMISVRSSLTVHMRSHSGEKSFTCLLCGQRFTRQSGLTSHHQFVHKEDGLKCLQCSTSFNRRIELTRHMQSVHASEPTVECDLCGCRFTTLAALGAHRTKRHDIYRSADSKVQNIINYENSDIQTPPDKNINKKTKNMSDICEVELNGPSIEELRKPTLVTEMNHTAEICVICKAKYGTRWHLIQHIMTHIDNDDSTFSCQICNENIEGGEKARVHFDRIHSGAPIIRNEHCCTVCPRKFRRKDQLTRHMSIHIGVKNWQCEFCPCRFLRRAQLTKHHVRVHNKELNH